MANTLQATGERMNHLARMVATLTPSDEDTKFLRANLYDGFPWTPFRFLTAGADRLITADLNLITNGGMETASGGNVASWTEVNTGTGDVTRTTTAGEFNSGTAGMKLANPAASTSSAYQDATARCGEYLNLTAALKGDGTNAVIICVQDRKTGKWLKNDLTWQTAAQDFFSRTAGTYATSGPTEFQVESVTAHRGEYTTTLRIFVVNTTASATVFADDVYLWPSTDLAVVAGGHNIDPLIAVELRRSTDNFSGSDTLDTTMTVGRPAFYALPSARRTERYWRLKFSGTNTAAIYLGEWILTQKTTLTHGASLPVMDQRAEEQVRSGPRSYLRADFPVRLQPLRFRYDTTSFTQAIQEVYGRSRGGHYPTVFILMDTETDVIYGKLEAVLALDRGLPTVWDGTMQLVEMPACTFVQ